MKKINLMLREPAKIGNISTLSVAGILPYLTSLGRKGCKITVTIEGPDELIDQVSARIVNQVAHLVLSKIEDGPKS